MAECEGSALHRKAEHSSVNIGLKASWVLFVLQVVFRCHVATNLQFPRVGRHMFGKQMDRNCYIPSFGMHARYVLLSFSLSM